MTPNQGSGRALARVGSLAALALALAACADLPDVATHTCGNGVLEIGEDCEASTKDASGHTTALCGASTGTNACFFECDPTNDIACPTGYSCGVDLRCRQASGTFDAKGAVSLNVDQLATGDVDGDGYADLVAASGTTVEVSFGSPAADFATRLDTVVSTPATGLGVGLLNDDKQADVLVGTTPGIQTFLGSSSRSLDPFSYPLATFQPGASLAVGAAIDADPSSPADEVLVAWGNRIGFPVVSTPFSTQLPDPAGPVPGDTTALIAPLPVTRLQATRGAANPATQEPNVDVALGFVGTQQIFLYQTRTAPLRVVDTGTILDPGQVLRPGSGLFFGYFNGDDCVDLIAHVGLANPHLVLFRNTWNGSACTGVLQAPVDMGPTDANLRVLAVADFDGDGITDLVTNIGILRVTGTGPWTVTQVANAGLPYEGAIIADLNGDGAPDVAAFRESQPDVEVLINAGTAFNRFSIATPEPVQRLAAGDFDGDLTPDLAIVELDSTGATPVYTVSVSYGQFHGPPGPREVMDHFDTVNGLIAASVVGSTGDLDAALDLIVLSETTDTTGMETTVLFGSGARAMTSPLVLTDQGSVQSPDAFVVAPIDATAGLDLFAVGSGSTAFLYSGDGAGGFSKSGTAPWPITFDVSDAAWASGDIDGDGVAEIAAAERHSRTAGASPTSVVLFTPKLSSLPANPVLANVTGYTGAHTVRLADLDGDGDLDLLVTFDSLTNDTGNLQIGWNENGTISQLAPLATADGCIDAVPLQLDGDANPELVALCKDATATTGSGRAAFVLRRFDAAEQDTLLLTDQPIATASGGRSTRLLAADINGDGLTDLVVATRGDAAADVKVLIQKDIHATP